MDRNEEMQAIEAHVETNGVYRANMGEMFYGESGPSYRERITNIAKNMKNLKRQETPVKTCQHCHET